MEINRANMQTLFDGFNMAYQTAYQAAQDEGYKAFALSLSVEAATLNLPMLEQLSGMRQWAGPRLVKNIGSKKLELTAKDYEDTVGIARNDIKDDQYGLYTPVFETMAINAANLVPDIIASLFTNAANATWLDGAAFFGTTRKYGKNTIVNKGTSALSHESFTAAYDTMRGYKGHGDVPLKVKPSILVHGPSNRVAANEIVKAANRAVTVGDAVVVIPNANANIVTAYEMDGIANGDWFLLDARMPMKPVVVFARELPTALINMDDEKDSNVFMDRTYLYGTFGRAEAAFALPHLAFFSDVA